MLCYNVAIGITLLNNISTLLGVLGRQANLLPTKCFIKTLVGLSLSIATRERKSHLFRSPCQTREGQQPTKRARSSTHHVLQETLHFHSCFHVARARMTFFLARIFAKSILFAFSDRAQRREGKPVKISSKSRREKTPAGMNLVAHGSF